MLYFAALALFSSFCFAGRGELKRAIKAACGNMAGECIITRNFVEGVDRAKMADIIFNIAPTEE